MSSRPSTNLARIIASINLQEDDVVLTPDPLAFNGQTTMPMFDFNQIPAPNLEDSVDRKDDEEEFFTASPGSSNSGSMVDVPLTVELLTSDSKSTTPRPRIAWAIPNAAHHKGSSKHQKQSKSSRTLLKKEERSNNRLTNVPAAATFEHDITSDGLDNCPERERNKKRKLKRRQNGNDEGSRKSEKEKIQ